MDKYFARIFLLILVIVVAIGAYIIFRPFLTNFLIAAVLATIFYLPYCGLTRHLGNNRILASLFMCGIIVVVIIVPVVFLIIYGSHQAVEAYNDTVRFLNSRELANQLNNISNNFGIDALSDQNFKFFITDISGKAANLIVQGAGSIVKGTGTFLVSLLMIIFMMFFFFIDGKKMLEKIMYLTPLPNKYDKIIFEKFKAVSYSTVISTFATAGAQGMLGAIGFMIAGLPAFFPGLLMALMSVIPYIGTSIVWFPAGIFLLTAGKTWQGIFMLIWGVVAVSNIDNLLRAYIIKDKAEVHPMFVIFSIIGGLAAFGFWGVIIGPLIISLLATVMHIYELEFGHVLEK